ncbi:MAG: FAD-dependent oxidoreductase [Bacteroidota bacterium]
MAKKKSQVNRRKFLQASALLPTYSLFLFSGNEAEAATPSSEVLNGPLEVERIHGPLENDVRFEGEPNMELKELECDFFIAGGGPSGVCAALAAARNGAKVILAQDRSRLGGNSSSEVKMHVVGANSHDGRPGWREGGIIEELRLEDAANNPQGCWEMWDLMLYDKIVSEENITLLLDSALYAAEVQENKISRVMVRCDKAEILYRITARQFADCTGDSRLGLEAGSEMMWGHEDRSAFNEPLAWEQVSKATLGSSVLFTAKDHGKPMPYKAPSWARKIEEKHLRFRPINSWEYGFWWLEWGGAHDTIKDHEMIRHELLKIITGVWDYIKNSGKFPESESWAMDWVGMVPGKRESRRIIGDHILTQQDLMGLNGDFEDAVAIGGWGLDEHPPGGFDDTDKRPFVSTKLPEVYNIPLRSLYSRDIENMFMAGRNASCSHVAFTSTRVMATCAVMGQAAGTAAALCTKYGINPRQLYEDKNKLQELQHTLKQDDQSIKNLRNTDPMDLAKQASVKASSSCDNSKAEHVLNGITRDLTADQFDNRWACMMETDGAWIELTWQDPQRLSEIQLVFDTGFQRELTLSSANHVINRVVRAPQPETIRAYSLYAVHADGVEKNIVTVTENHLRLRKHQFDPIEVTAIRLHATATNGSKEARLYEIRCYA